MGKGLGHRVYAYSLDKVIKIPISQPYRKLPSAEKKADEWNLLSKYFPDYLLPSEIITSANHLSYCLLQQRMTDFENITPDKLLSVDHQFQRLVAQNRCLLAERGLSLDFLGKEGMIRCAQALVIPGIHPEISNIVLNEVQNNPHLVIADVALLEVKPQRSDKQKKTDLRWRLVNVCGFRLNRQFILRQFGIDIA